MTPSTGSADRLFEVAEVGPMTDQKTGASPADELTAGGDWPDDFPPLHPLADRFDHGTWDTPGRCICGEPLPAQRDWCDAGRVWAHVQCRACGTQYVDEDEFCVIYDGPEDKTRSCCADAALAITLDECGRVDVDRIAALLGVDVDEARGELELIFFLDPATGALVPAEDYLAGDVRAKLVTAAAAVAKGEEQFAPNVTALEAVQPAQLGPADTPVGNSGRGAPT